jgi:hypothetical protein
MGFAPKGPEAGEGMESVWPEAVRANNIDTKSAIEGREIGFMPENYAS